MGPTKWSYFYLYVILDIFSRRVVGWCVADAESAGLFRPLFDDAIAKHRVPPGQLTLHADRGGPMKAKPAPEPAPGLDPEEGGGPPPCCSPISASPARTTGRIPPTTIRSPKATSRP